MHKNLLQEISNNSSVQGLGFEKIASKLKGRGNVGRNFCDELMGTLSVPLNQSVFKDEGERTEKLKKISEQYWGLIKENDSPKTGDRYEALLQDIDLDIEKANADIDRKESLESELSNLDFSNDNEVIDFVAKFTNWPRDSITRNLLFKVIDIFKENGYPGLGEEFEKWLTEDDSINEKGMELTKRLEFFLKENYPNIIDKHQLKNCIIYSILYTRFIDMNFDMRYNKMIEEWKAI